MATQEAFTVQAFVTNFTGTAERFADNVSYRPLRETLRLAYELCGGIPGAWVGIRYKGKLVADLETNHRGELSEANIHATTIVRGVPYPITKVTPLNPRCSIFTGVFAG
jgi:hypothetical protein